MGKTKSSPPILLERARAGRIGRAYHVRLAAPYRKCVSRTTIGFLYREDDKWNARYFIPYSASPSIPCGITQSQEEAVDLIVESWMLAINGEMAD